MVLKIFERRRPRRDDNVASYHPLSHESGDLEKADDTGMSTSGVRRHDIWPSVEVPRKRKVILRKLRIFRVLLPSFLHASATRFEPKQPRLSPTAWLDGLRGVVASFVVLHHMSLIWFPWAIHNGWTDASDHLIQLPIIRLIISGPANVMVFFVISGYALSWKPLDLIQKGQYLKMYRVLASSTFRRHPRLFIPAIIICAPAPLITYFGGYSGGDGMPGAAIQPMNPPRFDSIWAQFSNYMTNILGLSDLFTPRGLHWIYSDSLWTLPIEFKSSLVVFTMLLALSKCTTRSRVVITLCVAFYSLWCFHWGEFLFIGGMLAVETNLRSVNAREPRPEDEVPVAKCRSPWRRQAFRRLCDSVAFLAALFVLSMPAQDRGAANSFGFSTLAAVIPTHFYASEAADYFWQPIAAVSLVMIIDGAGFLQRIFTTRLVQYLGRVSYALYLVHMLILHSLGFYLGKYFLQLTGSETYWQYGAGIGLAGVVVGCVIIWAADIGSRLVDVHAVRFTTWAYGRLCKTAAEA